VEGRRGGRGARRQAPHQALAGTGVKLLHDRRLVGHGAANIDHLAVGPGGITVIDTKNYRGKVSTERVGGLFSERRTLLRVGGRDCTHLVTGVEKQIEVVQAIVDRLEPSRVDVRGALCFINPDGLPLWRSQSVRGVVIDGTRAVAKLARRPGGLDDEAIAALHRGLAEVLTPA
jgi:hypothetical protein